MNRFRSVLLLLVTLLALLGLPACGSDAKSPGPEATVVFLHEASVLGQIDVLVDDNVELSLSLGELSDPDPIAVGSHRVAVRNVGAAATIDEKAIEFTESPFLVVVSGSTSSGADAPSLWFVNLPRATGLKAGESAVGALNLDPGGFAYDVWVGDTRLAGGLENDRKASAPQVVGAKSQSVRVFNAGDDPATARPVLSSTVEFGDQSTVLLVLRVAEGALEIATVYQG